MHFWIDKRSQFGRSRVSASLCNHGMGMSHYPPNRRNKTSSTGTQVHRIQQQQQQHHGGEGRSSNYYHTNASSNYALNGQNLNNNNNIPTTSSSAAVINPSNNGGSGATTNNNNGNTIGGSNLARNSRPHRETIHHQNNNGYNAIRNFQHHPQFGVNANFARQHHRLHHYGNNNANSGNSNSNTINTDNGHLSSNHPSSFRSFHAQQQQQHQNHHHQHPHSSNLNCNGSRSNQILDYSNNSANQIDCHRWVFYVFLCNIQTLCVWGWIANFRRLVWTKTLFCSCRESFMLSALRRKLIISLYFKQWSCNWK